MSLAIIEVFFLLQIFRSRQCCRIHIYSVHKFGEPIPVSPSTSPTRKSRNFRCKHCGFSSRILLDLKIHLKSHEIRPDAENGGNGNGCGTGNGNGSGCGSAAESENSGNNNSSYMMQPFVMQVQGEHSETFVSSMVYLPVSRAVAGPMQVTFQLVPLQPPISAAGEDPSTCSSSQAVS